MVVTHDDYMDLLPELPALPLPELPAVTFPVLQTHEWEDERIEIMGANYEAILLQAVDFPC